MTATTLRRATPTAERRRARRVRQQRIASTRTSLLLLPILAYFVMPLIWLLISATKDNGDLFSSFGFWFSGHDNLGSNVTKLFRYNNGAYGRWLLNTVIYSVTSAVGATVLATLTGYALAKFRFRGAKFTFAVILGAIMVPSTALVIPTYLLFSKVGLIDTPWAVILPSLVNPFGVYLMRVYAQDAVPDELLEAARVDGAGELRSLVSIALPVLAPGFVTVLLFSFVATWNNYFLPLVVLSSSKYYPVTVGLAVMNQQAAVGSGGQPLFNLVITGAVIAIVPLILAFLFLQRYWRGGLTLGSSK